MLSLQVQAALQTLSASVTASTLQLLDVTVYYSYNGGSAFMPVDDKHPLLKWPLPAGTSMSPALRVCRVDLLCGVRDQTVGAFRTTCCQP